MTPAINVAKKSKVNHFVHQYKHDPRHESYGLEAVTALGKPAEQIFKTLLFCLNDEAKNLAVAVIPVEGKLNLKRAAKAAGGKKAEMANPDIAQKVTGYVLGGISPLGQKRLLPTFIHQSALQQAMICVSAGKRGLEIELSPQDLATLIRGEFADICDI